MTVLAGDVEEEEASAAAARRRRRRLSATPAPSTAPSARPTGVVDKALHNWNVTMLQRALLQDYDLRTEPPGVVVRVQVSLQQLPVIDTHVGTVLQAIEVFGWYIRISALHN